MPTPSEQMENPDFEVNVMPRCPECDSSNVVEDIYSPDEKYDGQGFWWQVIHSYCCKDCGCEWTETLTTTREIEIHKHGKEAETIEE